MVAPKCWGTARSAAGDAGRGGLVSTAAAAASWPLISPAPCREQLSGRGGDNEPQC